jgi:alpha-ketoglutaric semialdehyde dehydrogenase
MGAHQNFIAGEWVDGSTVTRDINPSNTNDLVGEYAQADAAQTNVAIEAAHAAFPAWSRTTPQERHDILLRASTEILARRDELGRLLSREEGKTLAEGIGEATRAGQIFDFFAGEVLRIPGEKFASVRPNIDIEITRDPLGVIGIIAPWNFPLAIPSWKIAPALAYGNTVATGAKVAAACAKAMRRFQLEMGGKNPLVVLADADLKNAVECAVNGAYFSTGQRCTASSRIIVEEPIYRRFADALTERMRGLVVDDALKAGTHIGPVVDASQFEQDLSYIGIGQGEGAKLALGGERLNRDTPGFYMAPALFLDANNAMRISREEIFGPVSAVIPARDYDHALAIANDTEFGLCAGICTTSLKHASHFKRNIEVGMAMVNLPTAGVDYHAPFGGRKASNLGPREQGRYAAEFYTTVKTSYTQP